MEVCKLCDCAENFHLGRKGNRANQTKTMMVLNSPNAHIKQPSLLGLSDIDDWMAAWLTTNTGRNLSAAMSYAGIDLEDVYITNIRKCFFPKGSAERRKDSYQNCRATYFDTQFEQFKPRRLVLFGRKVYDTLFPASREGFEGSVRGQKWFKGVPAIVLAHPSAPYWRGDEYRREMGELMEKFVRTGSV